MDTSVFMDKSQKPTEQELSMQLQSTYSNWLSIRDFVLEKYPAAAEDWYYSGQKYGWNFRIEDKRRAIIYLLPRHGFFKAAFVFGEKASHKIWASDISEAIKTELKKNKGIC